MGIELPVDFFVKPVDGRDDLIAFRYDFDVKALDDQQVVTETEDGDLIIEGYAAVFEGVDREGENFAPGAFQRGIKSFLEGQAGLCYHHKHDKLLGKVLDLREEEGKGLWMRARVDAAIKKHPELGTYYEQIRRGSLNALSVGGFFKRMRDKIVDMDFTEVSITPVPVHPGTNFAVVAGKALASDLKAEHVTIPDLPENEIREEDFMWLQESINTLDRIFARLDKRGSKDESDSENAVVGL
jgi:HK97 family phage prohead protease